MPNYCSTLPTGCPEVPASAVVQKWRWGVSGTKETIKGWGRSGPGYQSTLAVVLEIVGSLKS
eukprot:978435-Rhodomonas_salina.2